jgi:flagellar hook protein FlgE
MSLNGAMYIGVSGLNSFATALEVVSDNIANVATNGFKGSTPRFADMVAGFYSTTGSSIEREGAGSAVQSVSTGFSMGAIRNTDNWCDLAINGNGFFNVRNPPGSAASQTFYTRDGGFHMDAKGNLVNGLGYSVLDDAGQPIQIEDFTATPPADPIYASYYVDNDGKIWGNPVGGGAPVTIKTLGLSTFPNPDGLIRNGDNLFSLGPDSGAPADGTANDGPRGSIIDFAIEGSNVDLASEMVDMIIYQADYNANSKSITTGANMLETVVNMIR